MSLFNWFRARPSDVVVIMGDPPAKPQISALRVEHRSPYGLYWYAVPCPKCGNCTGGPGFGRGLKWDREADKMHVACNCGYVWIEEPLDRQMAETAQ